ncbi:MAG: Xaa-Pro peptidase family protein [Treponema sp.]|nr:Xaa-Pro peptidase family protein [Treponema sp.]
MKEYTQIELQKIYRARVDRVADWLTQNDIGTAIFIDNEEHREPSLRYLTGHTSDAVLIVFSDGYDVLVPWDEILAGKISISSKMIPFTKYKNSDLSAVKGIMKNNTHAKNMKIDLPPYLTYPKFLKYVDALNDYDCLCRDEGVHKFVTECRMVKDEYEIECTKEACRIGDKIIDKIEKQVKSGKIKTEMDVALLIEKELRLNGCERTGFDTLAAGPSRSFAIHAFPGYTDAAWPADGLSILDFGVVYNGYTSDTTLTIAKGNLSKEQKEQLELVEKAYNECLKLYKPGASIKAACDKAEKIFAAAKRKMPHTLGHGIGLEIHEYPRVSSRNDEKLLFQPGMILTCEPGLYDEKLGGCRWENDVLITETGNEVLSNSRIICL